MKEIQILEDDFFQIMDTLREAGVAMAKDPRTKIEDERWALFSRVVGLVSRYDRRVQEGSIPAPPFHIERAPDVRKTEKP